jgi:hypothetical protein
MISHTALFIALKSYLISLQPFGKKLQFLPWDRLLSSTSTMPLLYRSAYKLSTFRLFRSFLLLIDDFFFPGDIHHLLSRKYWVSQRLLEQRRPFILVQLGAGLDLYSFLNRTYMKKAYELDVEPMLKMKPELSREEKSLIHRIPWNAQSEPFPKELFKHNSLPTVIITEGFLEYQDLDLIKTWIREIQSLSSEVHWISTFFDFSAMSRKQRNRFKFWIGSVGETLRFPFSDESPKQVFKELGFELVDSANPAELKNLFKDTPKSFLPLEHFYLYHFFNSSSRDRTSSSVQ